MTAGSLPGRQGLRVLVPKGVARQPRRQAETAGLLPPCASQLSLAGPEAALCDVPARNKAPA